MNPFGKKSDAGEPSLQHLFVFNGGFLWQRHLRRILACAGYQITLGRPKAGDSVAVWGMSPTSHRGETIAKARDAHLIRIEDAFLRSMHPGRAGEPPLGLLIDKSGIHFDSSRPSDLETLLNTDPLDNAADLNRAKSAMMRIKTSRLSKYSADDPSAAIPTPGYVLVVDQILGDASVKASSGNRNRFLEMLYYAREENPGARILIKAHPETNQGFRAGHFQTSDATGPVEICDSNIAPMVLLEGAIRVYTLSSQMGFDAIIAGHKPRVFGTPFYAGWGLSDDEIPLPRRTRNLTRAQLFLGAMIHYPIWCDPYTNKKCELEDILSALEAKTRAWRENYKGWTAYGIRLWKRGFFQRYFGRRKKIIFKTKDTLPPSSDRPIMVWGSKPAPTNADCYRIEDGFIRSRGLGAELVPPISLITDQTGIYFDPSQPSDLETSIMECALRTDQYVQIRSENIRAEILRQNISKYNLTGTVPDLPKGHRILVTGQVEDDASILLGSPNLQSNEALLKRARQDNPDAVIIWKPHPDVEAGLRKGHVQNPECFADVTLSKTPISDIYPLVQEVWTMTSLSGFEALMRGCKVTTLGVPFYAGWGLTRDLGPVPEHRLIAPRPDLNQLIYACLIEYPQYWDPITGQPCPVEIALHRLATGQAGRPSRVNRILSKTQGLFASYAYLWRN